MPHVQIPLAVSPVHVTTVIPVMVPLVLTTMNAPSRRIIVIAMLNVLIRMVVLPANATLVIRVMVPHVLTTMNVL